jgi:hypothetical protein
MSEAAAAAAEDKVAAVEKLTKKRLKIKDAIDTAIQKFSEKLKEGTDTKYASILTELSGKISKVRTEIDATFVVKPKTGKKLEVKLESQQLPKDKVTELITEHEKDAIFVVTGGSFNPPHNGHIGMFQKAYDKLMEVAANKSKKVYGVMVPASDDWIEKKLCKEAKKIERDCTSEEMKESVSADNIELKRIKMSGRVDLCKLSCDSYAWTDKGKFGAENMIVVNDPIGAQGEEFTSAENTYYLCGSDYYASNGAGPYKFICVLRKGVTRSTGGRANQIHFDNPPITGDARTSFVVKDTDIIIENDGEDNDASSTMLRNILTKIHNAGIGDTYDADEPTKKLLTKQVYCRLLNMGYIVGDKGISISQSLACGGSNDTDFKLKGITGVATGGPRSLCNIGSMCYMNAALQLFYSITDFKTAIKTPTNPLTEYLNAMDGGVNCDQARQLARALYDLAQGGAGGKAFTDRSFNNQEDASELITRVLSDTMFNACKKSIEFVSSIANIYTGLNEIDKTCKSIINEESKKIVLGDHDKLISLSPQETGATLLLPVTDGDTTLTTFKEVFDTYLKAYTDIEAGTDDSSNTKPLTDPNGIIYSLPDSMMTITKDSGGITVSKALKEKCKPLTKVESTTTSKDKPYKLMHIKNKTYISPGPTQKYFIVILKRTISDGKEGQIKLKHSVDLENATINIGDRKFTITGCVCHHGPDSKSGHYTYVSFEGGKPKMVYDDSNIVNYATYLATVDRNRTVDTEGYVLLFEDTTKK